MSFTFPSKQEAVETMDITFDWAATTFKEWHHRLHKAVLSQGRGQEQVKRTSSVSSSALRSAKQEQQEKHSSREIDIGGENEYTLESLFSSGHPLPDPDTDTMHMTDKGATPDFINPEKDIELLMYALPHHQDNLHARPGSSNSISPLDFCTPTLHGMVTFLRLCDW